jgi:purine-cytosine permease-like protein
VIAVAVASWTVATLGLLTVAGAVGAGRLAPPDDTFRAAVRAAIGGNLGAVILLVFGLGSLAPACFSAYLFSLRLFDVWPRITQTRWTLFGTTAAWLLMAVGISQRLELVFPVMGAVFAPLAAALTADYLRQRGAWRGPRRGVNVPGLLAWAVGLAVGLMPILNPAAIRFQPAAVFAYLAAFVTYIVLAGLGAESPFSDSEPEPARAAPSGG